MAAIVAPNIVTDGLVAYWDAGNRVSYPGAGTVWTDLVSGRVGTFYNDTTSGAHGPDFVGGNMGYLEFDGTDEWIKGPADGSDMDLNVHVSMSCWVWWDRGGTGNTIVAKEKVGSAQYVMGRQSTGFGFYWALNLDGVWTNPLTTETLSNDQWYHITGTYDGVSMEQYIDGVLVKSTAATGAISGDSSPFYIGGLDWAHNGSTPDEWLAGRLSTVQVYNKGLTAAEVLQNYEALKPRFTPRITKSGLTANFDAGDPQSYVVGDIWTDTANGHIGILKNGAVFENLSGVETIAFDGTDAYVIITTATDCSGSVCEGTGLSGRTGTGDFAFEVWHRRTAGGLNCLTSDGNLDEFQVIIYGTYLDCYFDGSSAINDDQGYAADVWYHTVITRVDGTLKSYKDGVEKTSSSNSVNFVTSGFTVIGCQWYAPSFPSLVLAHFYEGNMGSVRFYNSGGLTAAQVLDNFNATRGRFGV